MRRSVEYDAELVEETVRLELRRRAEGEPALALAWHRDADALYGHEPAAREAAFAALHRQWFRRLRLEAAVAAVLASHGETLARLPSLTFLRALRSDEEGADLGAPGPTGRPGVVRIRTARFAPGGDLVPFLDHELMHLGDLVDPAFGHLPEMLGAIPAHRRRLVQARYRLLWAVTVDGRLSRLGRPPLAERPVYADALAAAFPAMLPEDQAALAQALWAGTRPTHPVLLALAASGGAQMPREPGAPCPLCNFPTHRWTTADDPAVAAAIRRDAEGFRPDDGLCDRCLERYAAHATAAP